jgi:hypothetical protein
MRFGRPGWKTRDDSEPTPGTVNLGRTAHRTGAVGRNRFKNSKRTVFFRLKSTHTVGSVSPPKIDFGGIRRPGIRPKIPAKNLKKRYSPVRFQRLQAFHQKNLAMYSKTFQLFWESDAALAPTTTARPSAVAVNGAVVNRPGPMCAWKIGGGSV